MVLVICLIGLLIASPLGIFFSGEDSGTGYTMPEAVRTLNGEFTDRIEKIKAENPHDELDMDNAGNAAMIANWRDVLAIYAVRTTTDDTSPDEVATLTAEKLDILRQIFWDMNAISYWVETVSGDEDESDTVILHITVTVKDHLQMADEYRFNTERRKLLGELMQPEYQELFMALTGSYQDIDLSPEEIQEIIKKLPTDLSEERKQVVLTAYQLLGKVNYFWGGKSLVLGWDSRWGTPMKVTAAGSSSGGTVRPLVRGLSIGYSTTRAEGSISSAMAEGRLPSTATAHPSVGTMPSRATSSFILATVMWGSSAASTAAEISSSSTAPAAPIMWW